MSIFVPNKVFLRGILLNNFNMKKSATESHRILVEVYGDHALAERTCQKWFARFKSGDFCLEDQERPGQPKKFEDAELAALLDQDSCQTQEDLAKSLGVEQSTVSRRLKAMGMIQKMSHWVPHELKDRDVERRKTICELLLERQKRKGFLHRIVTGDEKWFYYENPKRKKARVKPGEPGPSQSKRNIHCAKVMLCIWWDMKGVVYHELLTPAETINGERYRRQLMHLKQALVIKRPDWGNRHDKLIFQHDKARPHVAKPVKNYLENVGWEVLPHPPYSPDIAPSDYYLFDCMNNDLIGQRFTSSENIEKWVSDWITSKDEAFFRHGIRKLPERWAKVVTSDGHYFH